MADEEGTAAPGGDPTDVAQRPQHPLVERQQAIRAEDAPHLLTLVGLLADSDREGFRRLCVTPDLRRYVEFRTRDVVEIADVTGRYPPFVGETLTSVKMSPGAEIAFTRVESAPAPDDFDLELRVRSIPDPALLIPRGDDTCVTGEDCVSGGYRCTRYVC